VQEEPIRVQEELVSGILQQYTVNYIPTKMTYLYETQMLPLNPLLLTASRFKPLTHNCM